MAKILVMAGYANSLVNFRGALLKAMVAEGQEVLACAPEDSSQVKQALSELGVSYYPIQLSRTGINPVVDLFSIFRLAALFRQLKPDFFLAYTIKPVIYGSIAARLANIYSIYSMITGLGYSFMGGSLKRRLLGRITAALYRFALKFNQAVFFQNPDDLNLFIERKILKSTSNSVLINGSGVDLDLFEQAKQPKATSFLLIARLLRDKGIYEYAQAAHLVKQQYPHVTFYLAGWIDDNPASIDNNDLQAWQDAGDIEFLGQLTDVRSALANCSVYVLPSYREGTPRTVLEAMSVGRAIITTDAPGCRETVEPNINGFLVPVKDVDALADIMKQFIVNPELIKKMGVASRDIAEKKYDVHKVNKVILKTMRLNHG